MNVVHTMETDQKRRMGLFLAVYGSIVLTLLACLLAA